MLRVNLYWIFGALLLLLFSCQPQKNGSVQKEEKAEPIAVKLTVKANDIQLSTSSGMLTHNDQPFTGSVEDYWSEGQLKFRTEYYKGVEHGSSKSWFENGLLATERDYISGEKTGVHLGWWPNGELKFRYHFKQDRYHGEIFEWYESGLPFQELHYSHGKEEGAQKAWRENGKLYMNLVYKNGKRYGMFNAQPCYSVKNGKGDYVSKN
jgi:antitoxin component YwqK of YwqJK toxin-antitoxin module